jgi:hypothetical protein
MGDTNSDESNFGRLLREAVREPTRLAPKTALLGGRFIIRNLLGSGGMGIVYETLYQVDAAGIYRLKQEFRALADVVHPNLVGLHELFSDGDRWFFTMDFVQGDTLLDRLGHEPNESAIRKAFAQLAIGIQAIHDAGKLHRDLKPTNVLLTPEARVVILDFGLASDQQAGGIGQTIVDENISGTPAYMAPEQFAARPASPASDWYAFGVMLFEALTGRPPFEGSGHLALVHKLQQDAPRPSSLRRGIPEDLDELCTHLLQRDPEARPSFKEISQTLGPAGPISEIPTTIEDKGPFVGRVEEAAALYTAFHATDQGLPVALFVHGHSGVGKSTLVEHFLKRLRCEGKAVVLTGRCYERESVPYKACDSLIDALSRYLRRLPGEQAAIVLPRQIHALARIFPALQRLEVVKRVKQRRPLPVDPGELRRVAFSALKELLSRIAEQEPLVLYVDDLQWSDEDGNQLLSSLISPPDAPALLLIGAYRSEGVDTSPGLNVLRERVSGKEDIRVREIELGALSERESQELATELLPKELRDRAARIAKESRGSPFFITELARFTGTGHAEVEETDLDNAIRSRVATLSDTERDVLEAICVSAQPLEQNLLRAAANADDIVSSLRKLRSQSLIRHVSSAPTRVAAYHDRIHEAVLTGIDASRLKQWHGRLARTIQGSEQPNLVALTQHYLGADDFSAAGANAIKAAEQAVQALAFDQAAAMYRVALAHADLNAPQRLNWQVRLAETLADGGRSTESGRAFLKAAEQTADRAERGELRRRGAEQLMFSGQVKEGLTLLKEAFVDHGIDFDALSKADPLDLRDRLRQRGYEFEPRAEAEIDPSQLRRLDTLWAVAFGQATLTEIASGRFMMAHAMEALDVGEPFRVARGLGLVTSIWDSPAVPGSQRMLARIKRISEQNQDPRIAAWLALTEGWIDYYAARPGKASRAFEQAEEIIIRQCVGMSRELSMARNFLLSSYIIQGEWGKSVRAIPWLEEAKARADLYSVTMLNIGLSLYWLAIDKPDRARRALQEALSQWSEETVNVLVARGLQALCDAYEGDFKGWDRINQTGERLQGTYFAMYLQLQCQYHWVRGLVALSLADKHPDREKLLACAEQDAEALEHPRSRDGRLLDIRYWTPHAKLMRAGIAASNGDRTAALRFLEEPLQKITVSEETSRVLVACTRRRRGQLLGGEQGAALVEQAEADLNRIGVVNISRFCALLVPGFDRLIDE